MGAQCYGVFGQQRLRAHAVALRQTLLAQRPSALVESGVCATPDGLGVKTARFAGLEAWAFFASVCGFSGVIVCLQQAVNWRRPAIVGALLGGPGHGLLALGVLQGLRPGVGHGFLARLAQRRGVGKALARVGVGLGVQRLQPGLGGQLKPHGGGRKSAGHVAPRFARHAADAQAQQRLALRVQRRAVDELGAEHFVGFGQVGFALEQSAQHLVQARLTGDVKQLQHAGIGAAHHAAALLGAKPLPGALGVVAAGFCGWKICQHGGGAL